MNPEVGRMLESTLELVEGRIPDRVQSWDNFLELVAVDSNGTLINGLNHRFEWLFGDKEFAKRVLKSYDYQLLKSDYFDHLGEIFAKRVIPYLTDSYSLQSMSDSVQFVQSSVRYTRNVISVLDKEARTGRLIMAAYKQAPNGVFFGVDSDIRMARIAMTNLGLFNIRGFILCADITKHEIDIAIDSGRKNWNRSNSWYDMKETLLPRVQCNEKSLEHSTKSVSWSTIL